MAGPAADGLAPLALGSGVDDVVILFWAGVIGAGAGLAHWGPPAWSRLMASDAGIWVLGALCLGVAVLVVGGLWAAGQMSTGTPYP